MTKWSALSNRYLFIGYTTQSFIEKRTMNGASQRMFHSSNAAKYPNIVKHIIA
ncbi:MAG TPA: hypothetical protein PLQ78_08140 [Flavipsychrobacter sp.]|nr:hypothetical protein [Flavipsychrobacter sp.]